VLWRVSADGQQTRIALAPPSGAGPGWRILDVVVDNDSNIYLLELLGDVGDHQGLRRLDSRGSTEWERRGIVDGHGFDFDSLRGTFDQLLIDRLGNVYLSAGRHRGSLAWVDSQDGALRPLVDWGEWTGEVLLDVSGRVFFVRYLANVNRRAWVCLDPGTGKETVVVADWQAWQYLAQPFGVDGTGRAYGFADNTTARLNDMGKIDWEMRLDNVAVGRDGRLVLSAMTTRGPGSAIDVSTIAPGGGVPARLQLALPDDLRAVEGIWRVVGCTDDDGFLVHGGASRDTPGVLVAYDSNGRPGGRELASPDVMTAHFDLHRPTRSSVLADGSMLRAVLGPEGVHVVLLAT
jgi:hypothetical protein